MFELRTQGGTQKLRNLALYLTSPHELWARSYAQWVAIRSGDKTMIQGLIKNKTSAINEAYPLSQWESVSFGPIAKAIDDLFALLGWRIP